MWRGRPRPRVGQIYQFRAAAAVSLAGFERDGLQAARQLYRNPGFSP